MTDKLSRFRNLSGSQFDRSRWSKAAAPQRAERDIDQARVAYDQRKLIPARITQALDLRQLYGPEVDEACDAVEPDVDRWEAGELYPTWEQVLLLAKLTDFPPKYFFLPMSSTPEWTSLQWHLPGYKPPPPPILAFKPEAFTAKPTPMQGALW